MTNLSTVEEETLSLIAKLGDEEMSQLAARQWVMVITEYDQPGVPLSEATLSLIAQLQRALPPVPDEGWRSLVWAIANEARRALLVAGVRA